MEEGPSVFGTNALKYWLSGYRLFGSPIGRIFLLFWYRLFMDLQICRYTSGNLCYGPLVFWRWLKYGINENSCWILSVFFCSFDRVFCLKV